MWGIAAPLGALELKMPTQMRCGLGYDVHRLVEGRRCIVGGVDIPHEKGLLGHSDADVLVHAISDALLGAAGLGDIGSFYPDTDAQNAGLDSREILRFIRSRFEEMKIRIINIDSVIMAQRPKMLPYISSMKSTIAADLAIEVSAVGVKATTTEKLGFVGREEGIAAQAVAMVEFF